MKQSILTRAAILAGLALGAFAISAFADWSNPGCAPTGCNAAAPINVSNSVQYKQGALGIGQTSGMPANFLFDVFGSANITDLWINSLHDSAGSTGSNGNCLTSDGTKVTWGSCGSGGSGGVTSVTSGTTDNLTVTPTTGNVVVSAHGTVGGGCAFYGPYGSSGQNYAGSQWGNATYNGFTTCTCPSNYTVQNISNIPNGASITGPTTNMYLCIRN